MMEEKVEGTGIDRLGGPGYFQVTSVCSLLLNKEF